MNDREAGKAMRADLGPSCASCVVLLQRRGLSRPLDSIFLFFSERACILRKVTCRQDGSWRENSDELIAARRYAAQAQPSARCDSPGSPRLRQELALAYRRGRTAH